MQPELSPGFCSLKAPLKQDSFDSIPFLLSCLKSGKETLKPEVLGCRDESVSPLDTWHSELSVENEAVAPQGIFHSSRLAVPQWGYVIQVSFSFICLCPLAHTHKTVEKSTRRTGA